MAAALRLAESGFDVTVFEKRSVLGGRASSFVPPGETTAIDNCQHVLLACCTNLLDFFERAGVGDRFRFYDQFVFRGDGKTATLSASILPAPLHFLPSLASFGLLPWRDRWAIGRAMLAILRTPQPFPDEPLIGWLDRRRQSATAREHFWRAVLVSALNEDLERLSTRAAFHVFFDSFLRNRSGYRMGVPTVPLSELYSGNVLAGKCRLRLGASVVGLDAAGAELRGVRLQDGEVLPADYCISALPPDALSALTEKWHWRSDWGKFQWSPITGVHLWFDRTVMSEDHLTVTGRTIQWIFNKSAFESGPNGAAGAQYMQLVISASRSLLTMKREEILERCREELREILPMTMDAVVLKAVVVKETKATFSFSPGTDRMRPGCDTSFRNFFLAGDWTANGWPPTMEGAVRSGYWAAERVCESAGQPQKFLVPDLPTDWLPRLLRRER